ncbi:MAG: adenylate/guanylate cyclase domain-containing protein [Gemmatimonadota bacterium]
MTARVVALRSAVTLLCIVSAALIALVTPPPQWLGAQLAVIWIARLTVWFACALALSIVWLQARHAATPPLALFMTFGSLGCALATAAIVRDPLIAGLPRTATAAAAVISLLLATAALARVSITFPRPFTRGDLFARLETWRPAADRKRQRDRTYYRYRKFDNWFIGWMVALLPRARRKAAIRTFVQQRRQNLVGGKPQLPTSWLGLPWSAWRIGIAAAGVTAVLFAVAPREAALLTATLVGVILVIHAWVYLALGYQLGDAVARRQMMWVFTGSVVAIAVISVAGMLSFLMELFFAGTALAGLEIYRDGPLARLLEGPVSSGSFLLGGFVVIASFAIAIFRYGALDPKLVIQNTALYGAVGFLLTGAFIVLESVASSVIESRLALPASAGSWIAGAAVALSFGPLRLAVMRRTSAIVDRMIPATALAEGNRRLAAIVFTDLVGYTSLTAINERQALTAVSLLHKEARNIATQFGGRIIKSIGDAVLMEYGSVDAGYRATEKLYRQYAAGCEVLGLERVALQSGLHWGEVIEGRDGDVFGETVNLAARLQSLADSNRIILSATAASMLPELTRIRLERLGHQQLRNVATPVECYRSDLVPA